MFVTSTMRLAKGEGEGRGKGGGGEGEGKGNEPVRRLKLTRECMGRGLAVPRMPENRT